MSIDSEIKRLQTAKERLRTAVIRKGGTVNGTLDNYATAVLNIPSGGGTEIVEQKDVNFWDFDGTLLWSYTVSEFENLTELPPLPNREDENLTCQGWNYTLEEIEREVDYQGKCCIGANYVTTDGKTYIHITIDDNDLTVKSEWSQSKAHGIIVDWGDGTTGSSAGYGTKIEDTYNSSNASLTHTYSRGGDYVITFMPIDDDVEWAFCGWYHGMNLIEAPDTSKVLARCSSFTRRISQMRLGKGIVAVGYMGLSYMPIETLNFPKTIRKINGGAFDYLWTLKTIIFPHTLTSIKTHDTIQRVFSLEVLSVPPTITSAATHIHSSTGMDLLRDFTLPKNFPKTSINMPYSKRLKQFVPNLAASGTTYTTNFSGCFSYEHLEFPPSTSAMSTVMNCYNLKYVKLGELVTSLPQNCFYGCSSLEEVELPPSLVTINTNAFYQSQIQEILLPDTVTTLSGTAFNYAVMLKYIKMSPNITNIPAQTFQDCGSLEIVDFTSNTSIPTLANTNAFNNAKPGFRIVVPQSLYSTWRTSTNWSTYADNICYTNSAGQYMQ